MRSIRNKYSAEFKAKVVLEALSQDKTTAEIASKYQIHPTQVRKWKRMVLDSLPLLFKENNQQNEKDRLIEELYREIGKLKVELDWILKKDFKHFLIKGKGR